MVAKDDERDKGADESVEAVHQTSTYFGREEGSDKHEQQIKLSGKRGGEGGREGEKSSHIC